MSLSMNMPSAKIYQFTARKRSGSPDDSTVRRARAEVVALRPAPAPVIQWGASYHEEAIAEAARANRG